MKKMFIVLWAVFGLFSLGMGLLFLAAFTTRATAFTGQADLFLKIQNEKHEAFAMTVVDTDGHAVHPEASTGYYLLHPRFEARETNIYDTWAEDGPLPRTAIVAFDESTSLPGTVKHHEVQFVFDRHGRVWQAIVQFPDPSINDVQVRNSSLDFKGLENGKRRFDSTIFATAVVGAPIIKND